MAVKMSCSALFLTVHTTFLKLTVLLQADVCVPVLQSGGVQRVLHPVCGQSCAGDPGRTGKGSGADPGVRAAADPTAQL